LSKNLRRPAKNQRDPCEIPCTTGHGIVDVHRILVGLVFGRAQRTAVMRLVYVGQNPGLQPGMQLTAAMSQKIRHAQKRGTRLCWTNIALNRFD
jgi:hypothetical protein